jgi:hypothetical protein
LLPRIRIALDVYLYSVLGLVLVSVPWTPLWDDATLVLLPTSAGPWIRSGWSRGLASGVGTLDLWVAGQAIQRLWRLVRADARSAA